MNIHLCVIKFENFPDQVIIHRCYNLRKFSQKKLHANEFIIALPCFYTESNLNLDIHCCVESPQYRRIVHA